VRRLAPIALSVAALIVVGTTGETVAGKDGPAGERDVVFVANAEGGTVSVVDARRLEVVKEIDVLPDGPTADSPDAQAGQQLIESVGGKNYAQDQDLSPNGRILYVTRGHRGDLAAFRVRTGEMLWKLRIRGLRADHMTISPDGHLLYVSAMTDNVVEVVDTEQRAVVGSFATGDWPHDNHFSEDGELLYNGSIGNIVVPEEARGPGSYQLTAVDPETFEVVRSYEFDRGIRPYALTHDGRRLYAQLSQFHGIVEFDLRRGEVVDRVELPIDNGVTEEDWDFEAPHHGLALSPDERTLCAAGRASDYVALVATRALSQRAIIEVGDAPGWAENSPNGRRCFVTNNRDDTLSAISYRKREEVARIPVGDGPKHIEPARVPAKVLRH
jgi:DNA-binding beta-propeller fold protein YncE